MTAIGWFLVTWPWLKSNVSWLWCIKQCIPLGIHCSMWSKHGGKWHDRRQQIHCQFSFSWMNTITQTWNLKLKRNNLVIPEKKQQLVEETDADNMRKVLCKSFIKWFWELNLCCYKYRVNYFGSQAGYSLLLLKWKSRNLMSGPSGNQLGLFSLKSWCFPRQKSWGNKTNCFTWDLT